MALYLVKLIGIISLIVTGNATGPSDLWLSYTASFGRQGADCAGRGVCSFVENDVGANVRLAYSPTDSVMTMQIINSKVQPSVLERQITQEPTAAFPVSDMVFEMEGDYVLPQAVKGSLGMQKGLQRIPQGKYRATGQAGITIVQFKIR